MNTLEYIIPEIYTIVLEEGIIICGSPESGGLEQTTEEELIIG